MTTLQSASDNGHRPGRESASDATPIEHAQARWAAYDLDLKPTEADGIWTGQCPVHRSEHRVTVEEGDGLDAPVVVNPCPGGCHPEEIMAVLSLDGDAQAPAQWTRVRERITEARFGSPDAAGQYLRVVAALVAQGYAGRRSDLSGTAQDGRYQCPVCGAPGDGRGLKVSVGRDQPVVLRCFACQAAAADLLVALKLTWDDIARPLAATVVPPVTVTGSARPTVTVTSETAGDERSSPGGRAAGEEHSSPAATAAPAASDLGSARRLAAEYGDRIRYVVPWDTWLIWDGRRWKPDDTGQICRYAKAIADSTAARKASRTHSAGGIAAMINLAGTEPGIALAPAALDADPHLVNCRNGTLDLRTLNLRPHDPADLITKLAGAAYRPDAEAPRFAEFLQRVQPDQEMRGFLARLFGYALLGKVVEHVLAILYGKGANGKTTLVDAVTSVFGDYGKPIDPGILIDRGEVHPTGVADLFGLRLAITHETDEGRRLAEGTVKRLTGGDRIVARRMRQDFFDFDPSHTVIMHTNHRPVIRGTDEGIWRRLKMIPFSVEIPADEQDGKLPAQLAAEADGILTCLVAGHREWQDRGLAEPERVTAATAGFRGESDSLALFLRERVNTDAGLYATVQSQVLFEAWEDWCKRENVEAGTQTKFSRNLLDRGYVKDKDGLGRMAWQGFSLWAE